MSPVQREVAWQHRLEALQGHARLPSVVGGVLQEGRLVWSGGVGGSVDDAYRIGSITKTLTAVAVLQLREEGLLDLDDPVGRVVPETAYADVTLRGLLSHTAGLPSEPVGPWWERSPGVERAALLAANDAAPVAGPGEWFHYSNLGYALLGEVVARLRGASWLEVVSTRLLAPLGMTRTTYDPRAPHAVGRSVDHFAGTLSTEPHQDTGAMAPAGQLWSTVADLARWAAFLADGHPDVLPVRAVREMGRPVPPADDYGLGLRRVVHEGRWLVGHTGSMPGFQASLFIDPVDRDGVVVLANATTGLPSDAMPAILLGGEPVDAHPLTRAVDPWVPSTDVPSLVRELLGVWFWGNTAVELRWHNQRLHLRALASGELSDVFALTGDGRVVGEQGYHRGERLHVVRRDGADEGAVSHLECATFVYTRTPYDPRAPIPGG